MGQKFSYDIFTSLDKSIFQKQSKIIILEGLEHFLNLYETTNSYSDKFFIQLIIKYLHDLIHSGKKLSTLKMNYCAIKAYFDNNDYPLHFRFNLKIKESCEDDQLQKLLTLNGLLKILTTGQPTITQKAVFPCKFHRGLDTSTFVDRFNFEAWMQIIQIFETDDWNQWDLKNVQFQ